jgi:hypothetical protein
MRPEGDDVRCETARPLFERVEAPPPIGASDGLPYPMPFLSHIGGAGSIDTVAEISPRRICGRVGAARRIAEGVVPCTGVGAL